MNIKHLLITVALLLVVVAVFGAASFALNLYTGPIIEANNAGAANDRLNAILHKVHTSIEAIAHARLE